MKKIGIVVDAGADLPQGIISENQIAVVQVKLNWPEIENLPGENTFQKMRELGKRGIDSFGKTSQPSPKDFLDKYYSQLEKFDEVICIDITSKLSGTFNSALQAKNFLKPEDTGKVSVIDTLSASGGEALVALRAIELIRDGKDTEEIKKELEKLIPQIHTSVIFDDPKWVETAGRISHLVANLMRRLIKSGIRPVLVFKNGKLAPAGFQTNAKDIPTAIFKQFKKETGKFAKKNGKLKVVITHGDDPVGAQRLKEMIEKEFLNSEVIFINIINNIVGSLAGPDALILAWCKI